MFVDLINHPNFSQYDLSSVNAGVMAGSTCPRELVNDCVKKLNARNVIVAYGLTETSPVVTCQNFEMILKWFVTPPSHPNLKFNFTYLIFE